MQPFDIRLAYRHRHWLTVRFELGRDEVGSTEEVERRLAQDITGRHPQGARVDLPEDRRAEVAIKLLAHGR